MRKFLLAGFVSLFSLSAQAAAPASDWFLTSHEPAKDTYLNINSGLTSDKNIVHENILVWFDFKTEVEIVKYTVDCPHNRMKKIAMKDYRDLTKAWPEFPMQLDKSVSPWLSPYDHALKEIFWFVCIGGE
jgi:hypothetical protein